MILKKIISTILSAILFVFSIFGAGVKSAEISPEEVKAATENVIARYGELLKENPRNLQLQVNVLEAMWEQMTVTEDADEKRALIEKMLLGDGKYTDSKTGKEENAIYGWQKINKVTKYCAQIRSEDDMTETFLRNHRTHFFSVLRLSQCRMEMAKINEDAEVREKDLSYARHYVEQMYRLYPDLGGQELYDEYEKTFREIQTLEGVPENERKDIKDIYTGYLQLP